MRTKVTLVLLFLNAALFFFIFHFERDWRTERMALEVRRRVLGAEAADIRSLTVTDAAQEILYSVQRRGDAWYLAKPFEWRANPRAVGRILTDLQFLEHATSFSLAEVEKAHQSKADYGLDHPRFTVSFVSGDASSGRPVTTTLAVGDSTKVGPNVYLLVGDRIHVVGRELVESLSMPLDQLRDDGILDIPVFEARSLNLQTAAPADVHVRIRRDGARWTFEAPLSARASKEQIELAINGLDGLRVHEFVKGSGPVPPPSEASKLRVSIEGDNRHETLFIGNPTEDGAEGRYYANLEGRAAIFTVDIPRSLMETLSNAPEHLRDRHVLEFDPAAVTRITLGEPNRPAVTLQRLEPGAAASGWQILLRGDGSSGPRTQSADASAVQRLLDALALLSARRFQSDAPQAADLETWGFNQPARTVGLTAGGTPIELQIGLPVHPDGNAYARVPTALSSVYLVDSAILQETPVDPSAWRDRLIRALPAGGRITGLKLTDLSAGKTVLEWSTSAAPPRPEVQALLDALRILRAQRFVRDTFTDRYGYAGEEHPWNYRLDTTVALPSGSGSEQASTSSLWLSSRLSGSEMVAGSSDIGAEFDLEQPLLDAIFGLTYAGRVPGPPPAAKP